MLIRKILYDLIRVDHNNPSHLRSMLLIFFSLTTVTFSQQNTKLEITGAKSFSVNDYRNWIEFNERINAKTFSSDSIKAKISDNLTANGFYHSRVTQITLKEIDSTSNVLNIEINEDSPTLIRNVGIKEKLQDSLFVLNEMKNMKGEIFSAMNVESSFDRILTNYENSGFPFAIIKIDVVSFIDDSTTGEHFADIILSIAEGFRNRINRIQIEGNTKTKDYVIIRAAGLNVDEIYTQKIIDDIPNRLNRLRFLNR